MAITRLGFIGAWAAYLPFTAKAEAAVVPSGRSHWVGYGPRDLWAPRLVKRRPKAPPTPVPVPIRVPVPVPVEVPSIAAHAVALMPVLLVWTGLGRATGTHVIPAHAHATRNAVWQVLSGGMAQARGSARVRTTGSPAEDEEALLLWLISVAEAA